MFPLIRNVINVIRKCPLVGAPTFKNYHIFAPSIIATTSPSKLLAAANYNQTQCCGFKVKGKLHRRCKDCYFVMREQRLYVLCKTHGRHKQMSMVKDPKNTWILTHATQGKVRPW